MTGEFRVNALANVCHRRVASDNCSNGLAIRINLHIADATHLAPFRGLAHS